MRLSHSEEAAAGVLVLGPPDLGGEAEEPRASRRFGLLVARWREADSEGDDVSMKARPVHWRLIAHFARRRLLRDTDRATAEGILRRGRAGYVDLVESVEGVGESNPMASNLHWACALFALWDASERALSVEDLLAVVEALTTSFPMRLLGRFGDLNKPEVMRGFARRIEETAQWARHHRGECPAAWQIEPGPGPRRADVFFRITRCPLADMAKARGYGEIMPAICGSDYLTVALFRGELLRERTIAEGASDCDFLIRARAPRRAGGGQPAG